VLFINRADVTEIPRKSLPAGNAPSFATPVYTGLGSVVVRDDNTGLVLTLQ